MLLLQFLSLLLKLVNGGHEAIAITDHAVAQSFPEAYSAGKKAGIKVIYGVEANLVNDGVPIAYNEAHRLLAEGNVCCFRR